MENRLKYKISSGFDKVATVLFFTIIAGFLMNLFIIISSFFATSDLVSYFLSELSILASLALIPFFIFKRFIFSRLEFSENMGLLGLILVLAVFVSRPFVDLETSIHFMIIAISEEVLFREIYYQYLMAELKISDKRSRFLWAMVITSFIFATILHLNESFVINILVRMPLGMVLFTLRHFARLKSAIVFHWIYNIFVTFYI